LCACDVIGENVDRHTAVFPDRGSVNFEGVLSIAQKKVVQRTRHDAADYCILDIGGVQELEPPKTLHSPAKGALDRLPSTAVAHCFIAKST
jgi:hypothetical protein